MGKYRYLVSFAKNIVCKLLCWICIFFGILEAGLASQNLSSPKKPLQSLRELVKKNEALANLIKMDYTLRFEQNEQRLKLTHKVYSEGKRFEGSPYTQINGTWAQDGIKQYCDTQRFFAGNEPGKSYIKIIDGEVSKWGKKPDFMQGGIGKIGDFDWGLIPPARLAFRAFAGWEYLLSDILVEQYSSMQNETAMVGGREAYVVDVINPGQPLGSARIWFDRERGLPLRFDYFNNSPTSGQAHLTCRIESIKHFQLPNGGWIAIEGKRSVHFYKKSPPIISTEHISVDINSITIQRKDIPESLFSLTFPPNARVANTILGIVSKGGMITSVERIVKKSIEALNAPDSTYKETSTPQQPKHKPTSRSSQEMVSRESPNEPNHLNNQENLNVLNPSQTSNFDFTYICIFLSVVLATFAFTIIVWIIFQRSKGHK